MKLFTLPIIFVFVTSSFAVFGVDPPTPNQVDYSDSSYARYLACLGSKGSLEAFSDVDEPDFLKSANLSNPDWVRLFVRFPGNQFKPNVTYLSSMMGAMRVFDKWIRGKSEGVTYEDMMSAMHLIAVHGKTFRRSYRGTLETNVDDFVAGIWRGEEGQNRAYSQMVFLHKESLKFISLGQFTFFVEPSIPWRKDLDHGMNGFGKGWRNKIHGNIPVDRWPITLYSGMKDKDEYPFFHFYPESADVKLYRNVMKNLMEGLRKELSQPILNRAKFEQLLALYYHTGANALPFPRVNNSLLMAQVNYLLKLVGSYPGLYHTSLDGAALVSDSDEFVDFFRQLIQTDGYNINLVYE